jgi:hypothetical protein
MKLINVESVAWATMHGGRHETVLDKPTDSIGNQNRASDGIAGGNMPRLFGDLSEEE